MSMMKKTKAPRGLLVQAHLCRACDLMHDASRATTRNVNPISPDICYFSRYLDVSLMFQLKETDKDREREIPG